MDSLATVAAETVSSGIGWPEVCAIVLAVVGLIQVIVRITPTKKDDKIVNPILRILSTIFSKTNTKNELKDTARTVIVEEAIHKIADRHPDVAKVIEEITDNVMKGAKNEGDRKGSGGMGSLTPKTVVGKKIFTRIDEQLNTAKPRTKVGKGLKRLLKRIC